MTAPDSEKNQDEVKALFIAHTKAAILAGLREVSVVPALSPEETEKAVEDVAVIVDHVSRFPAFWEAIVCCNEKGFMVFSVREPPPTSKYESRPRDSSHLSSTVQSRLRKTNISVIPLAQDKTLDGVLEETFRDFNAIFLWRSGPA
ncbi:MAG: hypothetical protein G01um10147_840 [Microgenomates group bacterium Gr01-1014_7]|nr:MAG: hypothetical protein G01um10147_840 [Microgenomates group bacterium Gr01-1014_7]